MKIFLKRLLLLVPMVCMPAAAGDQAPQDLVKRITDRMLEILRANPGQAQNDRAFLKAQVHEVIVPHLDFEAMTKLTVAKYWRRATEIQRENLIKEFRELLLRTYTKALVEYTNQQVAFLPYRPGPREDRAVVRSEIRQAGAVPVPVSYRLRTLDEAWKIYDITIDNVSLVTNYRSSFSTEIQQSGIDGLVNNLAKKNQGESK